MQLVEDASIVRGMIRVERGEDLIDALAALAKAAGWEEAFVTGAGELELVELKQGESTRTFEDAEVVALAGRVHRTPTGLDVALRTTIVTASTSAQGRVMAGMARGMVLVVDAIVSADRRVAPERVASSPVAAAPSASRPSSSPSVPSASPSVPSPSPSVPLAAPSAPSSPSSPTSSFDAPKAIRPPRRRAGSAGLDDDDDENPQVDAGDVIIHPQLGRLDVVGEDDSGGTKVRMQSGKLRVLRLDALIVVDADEDVSEGDGQTFRVKGPRRRSSRF